VRPSGASTNAAHPRVLSSGNKHPILSGIKYDGQSKKHFSRPHYAFDLWMKREFPDLPWCRYADDGLVHCRTEQEAEAVKAALQARLAECQLEMHPTKTKIVYCKDGKRKGRYPNVMFDFLGYQFRPRMVQNSRV
jgi:Reverse transcriptase (RNA-dependent DNA polymerase)